MFRGAPPPRRREARLVTEGPIRSQQGRGQFEAAQDHFEEVSGGLVRELPHAEVVNDEQRVGREAGEVCLLSAVEGAIGDLFVLSPDRAKSTIPGRDAVECCG